MALRADAKGLPIEIEPARPFPVDWDRWRDALLGGAPLTPIVEEYTVPEGWSVTIVEVATAAGVRVHAFYAILDRAVHASVVTTETSRARELFREAVPVWDDQIVALVDL